MLSDLRARAAAERALRASSARFVFFRGLILWRGSLTRLIDLCSRKRLKCRVTYGEACAAHACVWLRM